MPESDAKGRQALQQVCEALGVEEEARAPAAQEGEKAAGASGREGEAARAASDAGPALRESNVIGRTTERNLSTKSRPDGPAKEWKHKTLLPLDHPYQEGLYRWLQSLSEQDVTVKLADFEWDGGYRSLDQLANIHAIIARSTAYVHPTFVITGEPKWFTLGGIEGTGKVKQLRWGCMAAFWYALSLPCTNGKQGNPYYRNPAVGRRALVAAATDMMMYDRDMDRGKKCNNHYIGGAMNAWLYAYEQCGEVLDKKTRVAFEKGLARSLDRIERWGLQDVCTNMCMRSVAAAARLGAISEDPAMFPPFERPGFAFTKPFGPKGAEEFWAYRNTDGTHDFGFFLEHVPRTWPYGSWAGGTLQAFWTSKTGILILCRHNFKDTGDFSTIATCPTDHVWYRTAAGKAYTTAKYYHGTGKAEVSGTFTGRKPFVQVNVGFAGSGKGKGRHSNEAGSGRVESRFEVIANGLRVTKTVSGDIGEPVKEVWTTLPVFLRNTDNRNKQTKDATIEYAAGGAWKELNTDLVETQTLRLGRTFGGRTRYGYVGFSAPQQVKLSPNVWLQTYQGSLRLRSIHINLHKHPGRAGRLAKTSVVYTLTTEKNADTDPPSRVAEVPETPQAPDGRVPSSLR